IQRLAANLGLSVTARRKRSSHVTYCLVPAPTEGHESSILLDLRPDVVHHGLVYLRGELVLATRRRHADGFYVPSPALESLAILLHAVLAPRPRRRGCRPRARLAPPVRTPGHPRRPRRLGEDHQRRPDLPAVRRHPHPGLGRLPRRPGAAAPDAPPEPADPQAPRGRGGQ